MCRKVHLTASYYKSRLGEVFKQRLSPRLHSLTSPLWECRHIHYDKAQRQKNQALHALKYKDLDFYQG